MARIPRALGTLLPTGTWTVNDNEPEGDCFAHTWDIDIVLPVNILSPQPTETVL